MFQAFRDGGSTFGSLIGGAYKHLSPVAVQSLGVAPLLELLGLLELLVIL